MSIYCRLCAGLKTEHEIASDICDLQQMLTKCCRWQKSENENKLPQQVCFICMELLDNCWEFLLQVECAEKKLNEMLVDPKAEVKEDIAFIELEPLIEDIKEDIQEIKDDDSISSYEAPTKSSFVTKPNENDDDDDDDDDGDDNNDIDHNNDSNSCNENNNSSNDSEPDEKDGTRSRPRRKPFKNILAEEDYLASGLISTEGVEKLMAALADMKTLNWNNCKYKCVKCDNRNIEGTNNYISHCKSVHFEQFKKMKFFCYYCDERLRNLRLLNSHIAEQHYIHLKYQCLYCTDVYWDVNELKRHRRLHVVDAFHCEPCKKGPMKKANFMSHLTNKHKKKDEIRSMFTCDVCKNQFATISSVKLHILNKHAKIKNEICDQCGWCFAQKGNLLAHIRSVHSNVRQFQCTFCQKDFKTKTHLKNHMKIHSLTKSHHCEICPNKSFLTKSQLTAHMKTHAAVGEFTCSHCGKNFKQRTTWQTHERIHTGDLRYVCPSPNCPYKSNCWGNLNKHTTKQHGIDLRSERWKNGPYIVKPL